jgi:uncharacterized membrane protein
MWPCKNGKMKQRCIFPLNFALLLVLFLTGVSLAAGETIVPEGTRISLQLKDGISTKTNDEGDPFKAIITEPVYVGERIVIPKGSYVTGSISRIQRPGRFKGKALMTLLFQSISITGRAQDLAIVASLAAVEKMGINTEGTIEGESSEGRDAARVLTPALIGAGIGGLTGGRRSAGIGAGVGAVVGLATVFTSRGKDIEIPRGSAMDIVLDRALSIPAETDGAATRIR